MYRTAIRGLYPRRSGVRPGTLLAPRLIFDPPGRRKKDSLDAVAPIHRGATRWFLRSLLLPGFSRILKMKNGKDRRVWPFSLRPSKSGGFRT
jgi:hypothetical protein